MRVAIVKDGRVKNIVMANSLKDVKGGIKATDECYIGCEYKNGKFIIEPPKKEVYIPTSILKYQFKMYIKDIPYRKTNLLAALNSKVKRMKDENFFVIAYTDLPYILRSSRFIQEFAKIYKFDEKALDKMFKEASEIT